MPARELIYEGDGIAGVITEDKGVDKDGKPKDNFTPGYELRAKVTVLAEGPRGSLTKDLVDAHETRRPESASLQHRHQGAVGSARGTHRSRAVWRTRWAGRSIPACTAADGFTACAKIAFRSGMVIGLEYHNPRFDPHEAFQKFKTHPFVRRILEGGKLVRYGAKTVPYGGWYSMPRTYVDGGLIIGDSASLLNSQRLKGIHIGDQERHARRRDDLRSAARRRCLGENARGVSAQDRAKLDRERTVRRAQFSSGISARPLDAAWCTPGCSSSPAGAGWSIRCARAAGYRGISQARRRGPGAAALQGRRHAHVRPPDRRLSFRHAARRRSALPSASCSTPNICVDRCVTEYGNPCQYFCPAAVYEMVEEKGAPRLKINASNCVHCKTCDIADPYQIINWVPPEGGGGPNYEGM